MDDQNTIKILILQVKFLLYIIHDPVSDKLKQSRDELKI